MTAAAEPGAGCPGRVPAHGDQGPNGGGHQGVLPALQVSTVCGRQFTDAPNEGRGNQAGHHPIANAFGPCNKQSKLFGTKMHFDAVIELLQHAFQSSRHVCPRAAASRPSYFKESGQLLWTDSSKSQPPGVGFEYFTDVVVRAETHPLTAGP